MKTRLNGYYVNTETPTLNINNSGIKASVTIKGRNGENMIISGKLLDIGTLNESPIIHDQNLFVNDPKNDNDTITSTADLKPSIMSPEEFARRMKALDNKDYSEFDPSVKAADIDKKHMEADRLMATILASLGYEEGIKTFFELDKYYI